MRDLGDLRNGVETGGSRGARAFGERESANLGDCLREPANPFFDADFVENAVTEAHLGSRSGFERSGVEEFAGDIHDLVSFDGRLEKGGLEAGLDLMGKRHPDIESAMRVLPLNAGDRREMSFDGGEHGIAFAAVALAEVIDVSEIGSVAHDPGEEGLIEVGGAEILVAFSIGERSDEILGENAVTGAKSGSECFGESLGEDDVGTIGIVAPEGGKERSVVTEFTISGIFQDADAMVPGPFLCEADDRLPAIRGEGSSRGIFVVADDVNEFDARELSGAFESGEKAVEFIGDHALMIGGDGDHTCAHAFESSEVDEIGGGGHQDDIVGINEDFADQ